MPTSVSDLRKEYSRERFEESDALGNPFDQFARWFDEALKAELPEPNAMTLATATPDGKPSARIVLLKGFDGNGFTFFTNYESAKGKLLAANHHTALLFFWVELERQVRIEGAVAKVSAQESDEYYATRPIGSRLGAWASAQSSELKSRAELEAQVEAFTKRFGNDPPRPPHWGGYRLTPTLFEFWQGRESRLHDRLQYTKQDASGWIIRRLSP